MKRRLFVARCMATWKGLEFRSPIGAAVSMKAPKGCPGVMLVFDSVEALREVYPDVEYEVLITSMVEPAQPNSEQLKG